MDKVLIIEDDDAMAALYKDLLEKEGFSVDIAWDGEQGLQKALTTRPTIILLDIFLPKLNGISVLTKLRLDEWGKKEPIIILTNIDPDQAILENIKNNPQTYYLLKANTTPGQVLEKVKKVITQRKKIAVGSVY